MRQKARTVGNIVGKDVPISMTEVGLSQIIIFLRYHTYADIQDDNATIRTWHPAGPNAQVGKMKDIMPEIRNA